MNIGIDIRTIIGKPLFGPIGPTGVPGYTINLLKNMIAQGADHSFYLFSNSLKKPNLAPIADVLKLPNVEIIISRIPNKLFDHTARFFNYPKIDSLIKKRTTKKIDVYLTPHINITPLSPKVKRVMVVHDLSFVIYPEFFSLRKRYWHWIQLHSNTFDRADKIISVSNNTAHDIVNLLHVPAEKVIYIEPGQGLDLDSPVKSFELIKRAYNLPDYYMLFMGTLEPRKNIETVIEAFNSFSHSQEYQNDSNKFHLVIAGGKGWLYKRIFRITKESPYKNRIHFLGYVDAQDKMTIIKNAQMFVFPSHYEGIGFPVLEAAALGTPVITSHNSSLTEVMGNRCIYIDPYNVQDLATAMSEIISRTPVAKPEIHAAPSDDQSWSSMAKEILDTLAAIK